MYLTNQSGNQNKRSNNLHVAYINNNNYMNNTRIVSSNINRNNIPNQQLNISYNPVHIIPNPIPNNNLRNTVSFAIQSHNNINNYFECPKHKIITINPSGYQNPYNAYTTNNYYPILKTENANTNNYDLYNLYNYTKKSNNNEYNYFPENYFQNENNYNSYTTIDNASNNINISLENGFQKDPLMLNNEFNSNNEILTSIDNNNNYNINYDSGIPLYDFQNITNEKQLKEQIISNEIYDNNNQNNYNYYDYYNQNDGFNVFNTTNNDETNYDYLFNINNNNYYQIPEENPNIPVNLDFMVRAKGLANVGATCYMNATLQCFYHVKKLSENLINDNKITPSMEITYAYKNLIEELTGCKNRNEYQMRKQMLITDESKKDYYEPNNFKNIISEKNPLFKGIQANDSKDLILFLLEHMDSELTKRNNKNAPEIVFDGKSLEQTYDENFKKIHNSIFAEIFYGFQKSIMKCSSCGQSDDNYNVFNFLIFPLEKVYNTLNEANKKKNIMNNNFMYNNMYNNVNNNMNYYMYNMKTNNPYQLNYLPNQIRNMNPYTYSPITSPNKNMNYYINNNDIPKKITLDDCFKENESAEILNGQNQIFCNRCRRTTDAVIKNEIFKAPNVLILILNRGRGNVFKCDVDFPYQLDISKYVKNPSSPNNYELIGVISHLGESSMEGHFIAFCKHFDFNWYLFNDRIVTQVSQKEIFKGTPYILFYQNINYY